MRRRRRWSRARACAAALSVGALAGTAWPAPPSEPAAPSAGDAVIGATPETSVRSRVAWALLADSREDQAARHFSRLMQQFPEHGEPRIGYALSVAILGDLPCAARSMHLAVRDDPEALRDLTVDPRLRRRIEGLASRYFRALAGCAGRDDSAFVMLAAVHYLLKDENEVRRDLLLAEEAGHHGAAFVYLGRLADGADPRGFPAPALEAVVETVAAPIQEEPEPTVVQADVPVVEEVAAAEVPPEPEPAAATVPQEFVGPPAPPIDYDKLRADLAEVAGALDRFSSKLLGRFHPQP